ncbi:MAG: Ig-like domain-containing protein, partial [Marinobacter sp.]|nr:Ig-like domain-containing protein [Marinobacter sp.]
MTYKHLFALSLALVLSACGGGKVQTLIQNEQPASVVYSYPADGQQEASPAAQLVLRFSDPVDLTNQDLTSKIDLSDAKGNPVNFSVRGVDDNRSVVLTPTQTLATATQYELVFGQPLLTTDGRSIPTPNAIGADGIQFSTRAARTRIQTLDALSDTFRIESTIPSASGMFKPMDFSTFRLRTSQPVHPDSAIYGQTVSLRDSAGKLVPATLLVSNRYLTVDPCLAADKKDCGQPGDKLVAGQTYTLTVNGLTDYDGATIEPFEETFTPQDTGPTEVLYQRVIDSGLAVDPATAKRSVLNGQYINGVVLNSVLQGTTAPSQQTGDLYAELAYAPNFPGDTPVPLRIPRNTVLSSTSLDVAINGRVPILDEATGNIQQTGTIKVTMVSDATGYLYPNPYSDADDASRHVKLFMDVAMNTAEAQPNASLSQDLLRVELTGIAFVRNGILTIDAIGIVEPDLLGQEVTDSTIAFHIEADTSNQSSAPGFPADDVGPGLVSWMPGSDSARQASQRPGDPIIVNLDEPLDRDTLDTISLINSTGDVSFDMKLDGTSLAINPRGGFQHGETYTLTIPPGVTDLAGNSYAGPHTFTLTLPDLADQSSASPLAVTTYPGFPCVTVGRDLSADLHGRCEGLADNSADEAMPLYSMPADRAITVVFSQSMDLNSLSLDKTVKVEKVISLNGDSTGNSATTETVSGRLQKNNQRLRFFPDQPWQRGTLYRYTLVSAETTAPDCTAVICSAAGQALETNALAGLSQRGGPDMVIYFKGAEAARTVFNPLRNLPVQDVNADQVINCPQTSDGLTYDNTAPGCIEPFNHPADGSGGFTAPQSTRIVSLDTGAARVGCNRADAAQSCTELQYIFQTGGLNT